MTARFQDVHDPDAVLDYSIEWADWLADGDALSASTWSVTPSGLSEVASAISGTIATVRLSGGAAGVDYTVTNHVTTTGGEEDDRSILIRCRER